MARFFSRALTALENMYRFEGSQVTAQRVDLDSPVTLVHDVSRLAEMAIWSAAFGGFFNISLSTTHAVARSTEFATNATGPTAAFWTTLGLNPSSSWLWCLQASMRCAPTLTFREGLIGFTQAAFQGAFTNHQVPMFFGTTQNSTIPLASGQDLIVIPDARDGVFHFPYLVTPNSTLQMATDAEGAVASIVGQLLMWAGPRGVLPPGLA